MEGFHVYSAVSTILSGSGFVMKWRDFTVIKAVRPRFLYFAGKS